VPGTILQNRCLYPHERLAPTLKEEDIMFDRLVESQAAGTVKDRRNYFATSALVMSLVSLTAVVVGIFADDYSIGNGGVELAELIAPVEMAAVAPKQPEPRQQLPKTAQTSQSQVPTRQANIPNIMEEPKEVPVVSTAPQTQMTRPLGQRFEISSSDTNPVGGTTGRGTSQAGDGDNTAIAIRSAAPAERTEEEAAPRVKTAEIPKIVSKGVVNGQATSLPKPVYPATAQAVGASGQVSVQVLIDESGHVVSAHATGGHPLLRASAEKAALAARFTPTKLSEVPVKVTGIITYNFMRG